MGIYPTITHPNLSQPVYLYLYSCPLVAILLTAIRSVYPGIATINFVETLFRIIGSGRGGGGSGGSTPGGGKGGVGGGDSTPDGGESDDDGLATVRPVARYNLTPKGIKQQLGANIVSKRNAKICDLDDPPILQHQLSPAIQTFAI